MKRILTLTLIALFCTQAARLHAQESSASELEYVRRLRDKGWYDLAKLKIENLLKTNDPLLNAELPLELVRINVTLARQLSPDQRLAVFAGLRKQLEEFIAKNKGKSAAARGSVELAKLTSYHGQALLSRAMREPDDPSRHIAARPAEEKFIQAGKDLEATVKALAAAAADPANAKDKAILEDELRRARFDQATNLFDQARTYIDTFKDADNLKRVNTIEKAKVAFTAMQTDPSAETSTLAKAWLMKCAMEQTESDKIQPYYESILKRRGDPQAQAGVRLARYFHMQDITPFRRDVEAIGKNPKYATMKRSLRLHAVQREGESWVREYPSFLNTYEGSGVLYELGIAFRIEADDLKFEIESEGKTKPDPKKPAPKKVAPKKNDPRYATVDELYDKAIKYFDKLASLDTDRSEMARRQAMSIKRLRLDPNAELSSFDDCILRAEIEREKVNELASAVNRARRQLAGKTMEIDDLKLQIKQTGNQGLSAKLKDLEDEQKKLEAAHKKVGDVQDKHLRIAIKSLHSALAMATPKTPVARVDEARIYLVGAYRVAGDFYRSVIVAEALGRQMPPTRRSPEAAAIAIETYSAMQRSDPENVTLRDRLVDMADYVLSPENQRTWKDSQVTSMAHYHLGLWANRQNKPKDAITHMAQISPSFPDFVYTQGQLVFIAEAARQKIADGPDKKEQQFFVSAAKDAIQRMPTYTGQAESGTVISMYFFAKMEMAKYLYAEAMTELKASEDLKAVQKCTALSKFVQGLAAEFALVPPNTVTKESRDQIEFSMEVMLKYADLGIAETQFRGDSPDRFDHVLKTTKKVVDKTLALAKAAPADKAIEMKDYAVTGNILGLALRSNVQKGNVKEGKAVLDVLKRLAAPGEPAGASNFVPIVLNDIIKQIQRMKTEKDKSFKETKAHYTDFLDEIAKGSGDSLSLMMLGQGYSSLDYHAKAAAAYNKVAPPADINEKIPAKVELKLGATDAEIAKETARRDKREREIATYWSVRIDYIRALRLSKEEEARKSAEKAIADLLKHENSRFKLQAMMERNLLLEDQQKYRAAYLGWMNQFMKNPALNDRNNKDVAKMYYEAYFYYVRTMFKTAALDTELSKAVADRLRDGAARQIVLLEFATAKDIPNVGWQIAGPMFQELLKQEPELRTLYDTQKAVRLKAGP